ncbi:MAG: hypothetical protein AMXMBFR84_31270 [Candidatus Hydrogenedentota bacterium]
MLARQTVLAQMQIGNFSVYNLGITHRGKVFVASLAQHRNALSSRLGCDGTAIGTIAYRIAYNIVTR